MTFSTFAQSAIPYLIAAFAAAAIVSFVLTPLVRRVAIHVDAIDHPDDRRVNVVPIPRGGGIAVATAFIAVALVFSLANEQLQFLPVPFAVDPASLVALLLGGALAAAIGVLDDSFDLRARWQFAGQLALALLAVGLGVVVTFIANPFGPGLIRFDGAFAVGFTVLWIAGMINSMNFIDGLDGLSSGVALIAALTLGTISLTTQVSQPFIAVLCFGLAGALLGFLRWNFHPASVFVGTSGVMFIGYTLAVLAILGTAKVAVALLVLGVPIIDAFWIIVRRLAQGRSPFSPDRGHLHHRLLDVGLSHRGTVLFIYAVCIVLAALSLLLTGLNQVLAFAAVFVTIGVLLLVLARLNLSDESDEGDQEAAEAPAEIPADAPSTASPAETSGRT
ncbi:MAG TPA: MraY family glycosyltransferase [Candidatus Limnocylindrales bacterium]|nr:MraY family glycosyltransferase [Candidatus Limnocylindrales bacterium]